MIVSIVCNTYNHENYISQSIEGFLIQKTDFDFEILIHDDASTDGTQEIIRKYVKLYPNTIKPLYQNENQYSKGIKISATYQFPRVEGKYISFCEGDDYWTDPSKLQKQVDFLDANCDYGLVHGDCKFYYEKSCKWITHANSNLMNDRIIKNRNQLFRYLIDGSYKVRTATVLFRKELINLRKTDSVSFIMGDTPLWLDFSQLTKFKYFSEELAVYRIRPESISRSDENVKYQRRFSLSMAEMRVYYSEKHGYPITRYLSERYNKALLSYKTCDREYQELYPLINGSIIDQLRDFTLNYKLSYKFITLYQSLKRVVLSLKTRYSKS